MAVPKKRTSLSRKKMRHAHSALSLVTSFASCGNCGATQLTHRVCPSCGYYRGRLVVAPAIEKSEKVDQGA